jgi:hypothetical protein
MKEYKKELYLNRKKPDRVHFPDTSPSPSDIKLHEDNKKLIQWLESLKKGDSKVTDYEKGYKEAQEKIAKRMLEDKIRDHYVSLWTGLSIAELVLLQHKEEIEPLLKEGTEISDIYFISLFLEKPFESILDAVELLKKKYQL